MRTRTVMSEIKRWGKGSGHKLPVIINDFTCNLFAERLGIRPGQVKYRVKKYVEDGKLIKIARQTYIPKDWPDVLDCHKNHKPFPKVFRRGY